MEENNIYNEELINLLGNNRNIALNIISSVNLWLENCMLFQDNLDLEYSLNFSNIDKNLLIDMYIYGCSSQALSLIKVLQSNYNASFDEIDVKYDRIFGHREVDYGDYDIVFYSEEANELFLIEAKFFSDSLNSSGIITDFHKLFKDNGYYEHCRRRYDLVCQEPEKIKAFVETSNEKIAAHFLFVSSKPLEIEIQDKDGIVTFLSLNCFEQYLHGKILDEKGEKVIRPIHII